MAFVAPCRRAALWLEEGLAANARSLRPSPLSLRELCEACVPRWRRRPARPHPRPARPIDKHAVPQSVRGRWMAHRPSLKAWHSAEPPRVSLLRLHTIVLAHDLRERSAQQFERSQREGLELYPGRHSREGGAGLTSLAEAEFWCCLRGWRPAEVRKALGGKHARRSNAQSVRRAPAPPLRVRLDMTRVL